MSAELVMLQAVAPFIVLGAIVLFFVLYMER
jgi:hypothetical protein